MARTTELAPCPICGSDPEVYQGRVSSVWYIECDDWQAVYPHNVVVSGPTLLQTAKCWKKLLGKSPIKGQKRETKKGRKAK